MSSALNGLRVLDVTQVMAGPFCCQLLGDLGADVTKVEPVGTGDAARTGMGTRLPGGESSAFLAVNRNKRSIAIDLKSAAGREVFYRLASTADVLVENFRPGVTSRLGIDYDTIQQINPRIVYASISGFGQTGPYASRPGYDLIAQAMAGVMTVNGEPGSDPLKCGIPVADLSAGMFGVIGILAAHVARETTGVGQHVDVSLYESALALSIWETAELWATGDLPGPVGSAHRMSAPYQKLRTADGHIVVGANNQRLWGALCSVLERTDLEIDARFATNADRMRHRDELTVELESMLMKRQSDELVATLLDAGVPAAPIQGYRQACDDPHTKARNMVVTMEHPVEGEVRALGIPVKMSVTPGAIRRPAPLLGQHTDEVLTEAGFTAEQSSDLRSTGAVA
ncbi:CaiB/BaiF CoA transferase family protein [Pseudonocardia nigra]|uniref:CaiB/BaiF CoA transferase family protein n=1 Tax=Pseudonocardia nigra TaxID=1921578 RepID=UPI001C5F387B|nr:CoA transferase [Pseudonocardia nigra]